MITTNLTANAEITSTPVLAVFFKANLLLSQREMKHCSLSERVTGMFTLYRLNLSFLPSTKPNLEQNIKLKKL